jgi:Ala-tRNA(Pro) deacylase
MSIPLRLTNYLEQQGAHYEACTHPHSRCSAETVRVAHVAPSQLAKSVLLEDDAGCLVAVVPADKAVMVGRLSRLLDRRALHLSDETRMGMLFDGCERGALPAIGMAWGIETIVDEELDANEVVYTEAGDHECLLRMSGDQFKALMRGAMRAHVCKPLEH